MTAYAFYTPLSLGATPRITRIINKITGTEMELLSHVVSLPFIAEGSFALLDAARQPLLLCMPLDVEETNGLSYR